MNGYLFKKNKPIVHRYNLFKYSLRTYSNDLFSLPLRTFDVNKPRGEKIKFDNPHNLGGYLSLQK